MTGKGDRLSSLIHPHRHHTHSSLLFVSWCLWGQSLVPMLQVVFVVIPVKSSSSNGLRVRAVESARIPMLACFGSGSSAVFVCTYFVRISTPYSVSVLRASMCDTNNTGPGTALMDCLTQTLPRSSVLLD